MIFNFINCRMDKLKTVTRLGVVILLLLCVIRPACADEREWLITYPYWTAPQGELELEYWHNWGDSIAETPREAVELEYGLTDRYTVEMYNIFDSSTYQYQGWHIENRYRLTTPGDFPILTSLYLEYSNNSATHEPDELEGKLIMQHYFGDLNVATNLVWEKTLGGPDTSIRFNRVHFAFDYPIADKVQAGTEITRYLEDRITTVTPGIYGNISHNLRILAGYEQPISGARAGRFRASIEWEFNR